jgi:hypothetical protein
VKLHHERHSSSRDIAMQNLAEGPDHGIHLKDRAQKQGYDEHQHQSTASKALHKVKDVVTSPSTNRIAGAAFLGSIMVSPTPIAAIGWAAFAYGVASDAQAKLKLDAKQEEYVLLNELHQANITAAKYKQKLYEKFPHEMDKYFGFEHNIVSYHDVAGSTKAEQKEQKKHIKNAMKDEGQSILMDWVDRGVVLGVNAVKYVGGNLEAGEAAHIMKDITGAASIGGGALITSALSIARKRAMSKITEAMQQGVDGIQKQVEYYETPEQLSNMLKKKKMEVELLGSLAYDKELTQDNFVLKVSEKYHTVVENMDNVISERDGFVDKAKKVVGAVIATNNPFSNDSPRDFAIEALARNAELKEMYGKLEEMHKEARYTERELREARQKYSEKMIEVLTDVVSEKAVDVVTQIESQQTTANHAITKETQGKVSVVDIEEDGFSAIAHRHDERGKQQQSTNPFDRPVLLNEHNPFAEIKYIDTMVDALEDGSQSGDKHKKSLGMQVNEIKQNKKLAELIKPGEVSEVRVQSQNTTKHERKR